MKINVIRNDGEKTQSKIERRKKSKIKIQQQNNQQLLYDIRIHFNVIFLIIYMYTNNIIKTRKNKNPEELSKNKKELQSKV